MAETERRRRRPAVSCTLCRKRKIRCNREHPCNNCVRLNQEPCIYDQNLPPPKSQQPSHRSLVELRPAQSSVEPSRMLPQSKTGTFGVSSKRPASLAGSSTIASTPSSQITLSDTESMKRRIKELEDQLHGSSRSSIDRSLPLNPNLETSLGAGAFFVPHESGLFGEAQTINQSVMHKTRLFGQSHWINGAILFRDVIETLEPSVKGSASNALNGIQRCKSLARVIKSQRIPSWPLQSTAGLPPQDVADLLLKCYLDTIEPIYRILHIPSFQQRYDTLWTIGKESDKHFILLVKLVLAIGAVTYDESFSLRTSAIHWVYEAQSWYSEPDFKPKLNIQSLQTQILLLIARELVDVGGTMIWVSTGELMRTAMYLGLHRDPIRLPKATRISTEMRRRLWNTVLEICLQSSLSSGGPPLISPEDFDTGPPGNFNDEDLSTDDPVERPSEDFTSSSVAIILRQTFPIRLAITKFLNDTSSLNTYQEALRLDESLRASYKTLRQCFQRYKRGCSHSRFQIESVDFMIHRYQLALHLPFVGASNHESAYAFSRKVAIDTSLKIWCILHPSSSIGVLSTQDENSLTGQHYLARLALRGSSTFRITSFQASLVIATEVKTKLQEEDMLGPGLRLLRGDLVSLLRDAKSWSLRCIEVGETNMKGYLLICLITAYIEGLKQEFSKDELGASLAQAAADAGNTCSVILGQMVAPGGSENPAVDDMGQSLPMTGDAVEGWDLMMPDSPFNLDDTELLNWVLNGDGAESSSFW